MSERAEVCGTCRFFEKTGATQEDKRGDCRANPPTAAMLEVKGVVPGPDGKPQQQVRHVPIGMFPVVQSFYWCGKWEPGKGAIVDTGEGYDHSSGSDGTRVA